MSYFAQLGFFSVDQEEWEVKNSQGIFILGITAQRELSFSLVLIVINSSYKYCYRYSNVSFLSLLFLSKV